MRVLLYLQKSRSGQKAEVSKAPPLHMVLLDNPLSTIFSSHSFAFLPVATFLSLHQLAQ